MRTTPVVFKLYLLGEERQSLLEFFQVVAPDPAHLTDDLVLAINEVVSALSARPRDGTLVLRLNPAPAKALAEWLATVRLTWLDAHVTPGTHLYRGLVYLLGLAVARLTALGVLPPPPYNPRRRALPNGFWRRDVDEHGALDLTEQGRV